MKLTKALIVLTALAIAVPALAADDDGGWYFGLDLMGARPTNVQTGWVLEDPDSDSDPEGEIKYLEPSHDFSGRVWFGQSYGPEKGGWWVAYTSLDSDESDSASSGGGELWDILYNADDADDDFTGKASADLENEATLIDVGYWRPIHTGERLHTGWSVGLRSGEIESELMVDYAGANEHVMNTSETSGIGVRLGMNAAVKMGERVWLGGGAGLSYLTGDTETSSMHRDGSSVDLNVRSELDRSFSIIEAHAGLRVDLSDSIWLRFGYEYQQWNDALTTPTFPDDVTDGFVTDQTADVNWDIFTMGVGFSFGGND